MQCTRTRTMLSTVAAYHATGNRVRSLPLSIEKVLGHDSASLRISSPLDAIAGRTGRGNHKAV
jgi:hypothetical protein